MVDAPTERTLGRYRLGRKLGVGGMGEVYLAKAVGTGGFEKLVAVKVLSTETASVEQHVASLQREAFIGVHLDHDNVVQILDYGEQENQRYVAMEYVRGFSLDHVLRYSRDMERALPERFVVHVVRTVLDALQYVHGLTNSDGAPLELIHGDVTPSNVMLSYDGRIKLTDFGIAGLARELQTDGVVAGKPRYLPPDVLKGAPQLQATDVYAAGVMLYEGMAGKPAFDDLSDLELRNDEARTLPPLSDARPDCSPALAEVASRATHPRLWERYPTAAELRFALDDAVPRRVDDADHHRAFVTGLYARETFVESYGHLPSSASLGQVEGLAPHITSQTDVTLAPPKRKKPLRFGLSPALSSDRARDSGERLSELVAERLGRDVQTTVFADYQTLSDCLARGEVDFAWTPPQSFVEIFERGGGMLAIMERAGRASFESALVVRADSDITSLESLRGGSAAWVDRRSTSGYLFALAELLHTLGEPQPVLGREHFHGSHRAVCEAVQNGWADFGATFAIRTDDGELTSSGWLDLLGDQADELRPLAFVGPIPGDNLSHAPQMPPSVVNELTEVLTSLHDTLQGQAVLKDTLAAERLVPGSFETYGSVVSALNAIRDYENR